MDVEFFRKDLGGTISLLPQNPGLVNGVTPDENIKFKLFAGKSQSRGVDVYLGYDSPTFFSQLAYTYSKTEDTFNNINRGEPFPSQNDRRHQLKWLNALTVGDFIISGSAVYSSGRPYISFDLLKEAGGTRNRFEESLVNLPAYFRLDLGIKYELNVSGLDAYVKGSVYNFLNRQNVRFIQQSFSLPINTGGEDEVIIGSESSLVDRLFNITLGLNF
ncbi:MAG: TonB-dependent receptor [Saprospiraceae bacterium]|nr:TonB-dependent receptor [Saprospiraceae bacterium]